jgi:cysteine desulfurase/selenocysteine lyase
MAAKSALIPQAELWPYRNDFPMLHTRMNGKPLVFLDSAASAQKPQAVIDAIASVYETRYANIHRGLYKISQALTEDFEAVRAQVARFIGAASPQEIVFTRSSTESINLVAASWGGSFLRTGDEIILTGMEHHANIVPWQLLAERLGIIIKVWPVEKNGTLDVGRLGNLLSPRTRMLGLVHISNALGTINPVKEIIGLLRNYNPAIRVLVDGSQAVVHSPVNVSDLDADFYVFTGHKVYGPTGIGVLCGKYDLLQSMLPYQGGGDMIERVSFSGTSFKDAPARFEAGTPPIVEVIGLGAAIDYLEAIGMENIAAHESDLLQKATKSLEAISGLSIHGKAPNKAAVISFTMDGAHHSDVASILDQQGIAVRAGHHCCMPLMESLGLEGMVRASFGLYSNEADIDSLVQGLQKAQEMLA